MLFFFSDFFLDFSVLKTPLSKTKKRTRPIVAVAQSHLTFIKPLKAGKCFYLTKCFVLNRLKKEITGK